MAVTVVTEKNFEQEVLQADSLVLVDFFAQWCMPCKMLAPILEQVADEKTAVKVCKLDVDENMSITEKYGVMAMPTLVLFRNGEVVKKVVGLQSKAELLQLLEQNL